MKEETDYTLSPNARKGWTFIILLIGALAMGGLGVLTMKKVEAATEMDRTERVVKAKAICMSPQMENALSASASIVRVYFDTEVSKARDDEAKKTMKSLTEKELAAFFPETDPVGDWTKRKKDELTVEGNLYIPEWMKIHERVMANINAFRLPPNPRRTSTEWTLTIARSVEAFGNSICVETLSK